MSWQTHSLGKMKSMTLIAIDTETTGLSHQNGDRIIEIGMVEITRDPNPRTFHSFFNPEGFKVSEGAFRVHGISDDFLIDKPLFRDRIEDMVAFIGDAELVIHNAPFDLNFLKAEANRGNIPWPSNKVIDTLVLAQHERPGKHNSLDALCAWQGIDLSVRKKHGALVDSELLSELYLRWKGQSSFELGPAREEPQSLSQTCRPLNGLLVPASDAPEYPAPSWEKFMKGISL